MPYLITILTQWPSRYSHAITLGTSVIRLFYALILKLIVIEFLAAYAYVRHNDTTMIVIYSR